MSSVPSRAISCACSTSARSSRRCPASTTARARAACWAGRSTWRRRRPQAAPPTRAPICTRSASCSTRCWPVGPRSPAPAWSTSRSCIWARRCRPCPSRCRRRCAMRCAVPWRRTRSDASSRRARCGAPATRCSPGSASRAGGPGSPPPRRRTTTGRASSRTCLFRERRSRRCPSTRTRSWSAPTRPAWCTGTRAFRPRLRSRIRAPSRSVAPTSSRPRSRPWPTTPRWPVPRCRARCCPTASWSASA